MRLILVANLAGGVGKTSTVHSLATAMAEYGKNVLAIDADPGAFLTFLCGIENPRFTTKEFFSGESNLENSIVKTSDRFSLVPSASRLGNWETRDLKNLRSELSNYDVVLVDSPTGVNQILVALLEFADVIVAPIMRDLHSIRGLLNLRDFNIAQTNPSPIKLLDIAGESWNENLESLVKTEFTVLEPAITFDGALTSSQSSGRSMLSESPKAQAASDFREVAYGILEEFDLI